MKFTKMEGCGNDYVYVNGFDTKIEDPNKLSEIVSNRHFGIGSDGLIVINPSDVADFKMSMYNADGSEGKMCGNGIRCVAKYVYDNKMTLLSDKAIDAQWYDNEQTLWSNSKLRKWINGLQLFESDYKYLKYPE